MNYELEESEMFCPRHKKEIFEIRLDVYGCAYCGYSWLIKAYSKEKAWKDSERSSWHCPKCQDKIKKNHLDSYHCEACKLDLLIHAYRSEKFTRAQLRAHEGSR